MADDALDLLVVEDDPQLVRILQAVLKDTSGMRVAGTGRLAIQMIAESPPSIVLLDMRLPDMLGMEVLKEIAERGVPATVIVMTAHGSVDLAVEAMRQGAYDFLTKPLDFERVRVMVRNAVERHRIIKELDDYKSQYERTRFRGLLGSSPAMQRLYRQIRSVGQGSSPVLVAGEAGTEIEACARALHDESALADKAFAGRDAKGLVPGRLAEAIAAAEGGALVVRRVEELPAESRPELLAAWRDPACAARLIATAEEDLPRLAEAGAFDKELLVALQAASVAIPPLRDRGEDVLDLAEHLLQRCAKEIGRSFEALADEVEVAFMSYGWPGNTEELESVVRTAAQRHEGRLLAAEMLPPEIARHGRQKRRGEASELRGLAAKGAVRPLWEVERDAILKALKLSDGSVLEAARLLEVSPGTIYRKQQSWKARKG